MARLFAILALLFISVSGLVKNTESYRNTDDLFDHVLTGDHKIYVLFFFNSNDMNAEGNQELNEHVHHEKTEIAESLEQFDDNVYFTEIDTATGDFTEALQAFTLESENLKTYPATIVLDDSEGIWVTGPNEAHYVVEKIKAWTADRYGAGLF